MLPSPAPTCPGCAHRGLRWETEAQAQAQAAFLGEAPSPPRLLAPEPGSLAVGHPPQSGPARCVGRVRLLLPRGPVRSRAPDPTGPPNQRQLCHGVGLCGALPWRGPSPDCRRAAACSVPGAQEHLGQPAPPRSGPRWLWLFSRRLSPIYPSPASTFADQLPDTRPWIGRESLVSASKLCILGEWRGGARASGRGTSPERSGPPSPPLPQRHCPGPLPAGGPGPHPE